MNPGEAVKMDSEYKSFLAELGGEPPPGAEVAAPRGAQASLQFRMHTHAHTVSSVAVVTRNAGIAG